MVRSQNGRFFDHVDSFGNTLRSLAREIGAGLVALHRVQFAEPWKPIRK